MFDFFQTKERAIVLAINAFVAGLLACGIIINRFVFAIYLLVHKYQQHKQYHLRKSTKYNNSSCDVKNKWYLSKRYVRKLKMVMSGVSIQENRQFNV
jgi:hypothetical protein